MALGLVEAIVDADHDVQRPVVLDWRRDDHALHAALEIAVELLGLQELAGAFQHDVAAMVPPRDVAGRGTGTEADVLAAHRESALAVDGEGAVPAAVDAVELQQMRRRRDAALDLVD